MIFTSPVLHPPAVQLAAGAPSVAGEADGTGTLMLHTLSTSDDDPQQTGLTEANPNLRGKLGLLYMAGFNHAPVVGQDVVSVQVQGNGATTGALTWDGEELAVNSGGHFQALPQTRWVNLLIPAAWLPLTSITLQYSTARGLAAKWIVATRIVAVAFPTLDIGAATYAREKARKKSITGKTWVTGKSPDLLFSFDLRLKNEWRADLPADLALLDDMDVFGVFPCGLESALQNSSALYRAPGFMRNMVVERWTGWYGHEGYDLAGATGRMRIKESAYEARPREGVDQYLATELGERITQESGHGILINR